MRRGAIAVVVLMILLLTGCGGGTDDCPSDSQWSNRPDCEPIGDVVTVKTIAEHDPSCWEVRYYDDVGESAFVETGCG